MPLRHPLCLRILNFFGMPCCVYFRLLVFRLVRAGFTGVGFLTSAASKAFLLK